MPVAGDPDLKLTLDPPMQFKFDDRMWKVKNDRS